MAPDTEQTSSGSRATPRKRQSAAHEAGQASGSNSATPKRRRRSKIFRPPDDWIPTEGWKLNMYHTTKCETCGLKARDDNPIKAHRCGMQICWRCENSRGLEHKCMLDNDRYGIFGPPTGRMDFEEPEPTNNALNESNPQGLSATLISSFATPQAVSGSSLATNAITSPIYSAAALDPANESDAQIPTSLADELRRLPNEGEASWLAPRSRRSTRRREPPARLELSPRPRKRRHESPPYSGTPGESSALLTSPSNELGDAGQAQPHMESGVQDSRGLSNVCRLGRRGVSSTDSAIAKPNQLPSTSRRHGSPRDAQPFSRGDEGNPFTSGSVLDPRQSRLKSRRGLDAPRAAEESTIPSNDGDRINERNAVLDKAASLLAPLQDELWDIAERIIDMIKALPLESDSHTEHPAENDVYRQAAGVLAPLTRRYNDWNIAKVLVQRIRKTRNAEILCSIAQGV